ncbi:MAG: hypothetical protein AAGU11_03055 [Syntrophobacteraceae bacterium]
MDVIERQQIAEIIIDGLTTDGALHKQHYLEEVLKLVVLPGEFEDLKADFEWEDGVPG